jgi:aspartyl-tRNA(Asn)/glutamyl-tRNA(Gln) amidotransferase subunit A
MSDLAWLTIAEAAALIRTRSLSPVEYLRALLDRIARLDAKLNAFILVTAERALAQAATAEAEIAAGRWRGPLHGIPYALKDNIDVAGTATTCHSKICADRIAATDAPSVARLEAAGAILIGKTALHEFAMGGPSLDLDWPPARNPWNPAHYAGGSSSGSGVALAAGFAPAAIGTDTGGSIRSPATLCGVVGLKPTYGLVSRRGVFPLSFALDHVGPMARTPLDCALLLDALAGYDRDDPGSAESPAGSYADGIDRGVAGLRVGVVAHFHREDHVAPDDVGAALDQACATLRGLGAKLVEIRLPKLAEWFACLRTIIEVEAFAIHERWLKERPQDYGALSRSRLGAGALTRGVDYVRAQQARRVLTQRYNEAFADCDVLVTVSSHDPACRIDDQAEIKRTFERHARSVFNIAGAPAIAVPIGFSQTGLPIGMQIAARGFDDALVLRVAHAFAEATKWTAMRPPGFS